MEANGLAQKKEKKRKKKKEKKKKSFFFFFFLIKIPNLNLYWIQKGKSMFPNCIDRFGPQNNNNNNNNNTTTTTTKTQIKAKKKINGNISTYHEPLSEEWIGGRSWILHQVSS